MGRFTSSTHLWAWALVSACAAPQQSAGNKHLGTPRGDEAGRPETTQGQPLRVDEDTQRATAHGISYTVPTGWTVQDAGGLTTVVAPEGDARWIIFDGASTDPERGLEEAWKRAGHAPIPVVARRTSIPAREGWEEVRWFEYDPPPSAKRTLAASAHRLGKRWTIVILEGALATVEKRGSQIGLFAESFRPPGYKEETFAGRAAHQFDPERLARIDAFVEAARGQLDIPGVAIAIAQGGRVVHARGYGVRDLGSSETVDANTLFMAGSTGKALTTLLLAKLVDSGKLRWDQPVVDVYPAFKLGDPETTAAMHVEHLVCACTGLPRKDMDWIFEFEGVSAQDVMGRLASTQVTTNFGEVFQYSNHLAAAAGFVAAHVAMPGEELGRAYDQAMQREVFEPLGMHSTTFDFETALASNHASPHGWNLNGHSRRAPIALNHAIRPVRPAGGAWSSANDMIKYVLLELAEGVSPAAQRVVSKANLAKRTQPYAKLGKAGHYGMGLAVARHRSVPVVGHDGGWIGFLASMFWLPKHNVGAVILTNSDAGGPLLGSFKHYVLEQLFDGKPEAEEDLKTTIQHRRLALAEKQAKIAVPPTAETVTALASDYQNNELGAIQVQATDTATTFDFGEWKSAVGSRRHADGTVSFVTVTPGYTNQFQFVVGRDAAGKRTLTLQSEAQHEYRFTEVSPN